jgi:hypothetical protein
MNPVNILIIAFVCVTIGYIAGLLISNMRSDSRPAAAPEEQAAEPGSAYLTVAELVREEEGSPLLVHLEHKYYRSPGEMNPAQRQQMEDTCSELRTWLGLVSAQSQPVAQLSGETEGAVTEPVRQAPVLEPVSLVSPPAARLPLSPPGTSPLIQPAAKTSPPPKAPAKSIVMQINDILQDNVVGTDYEKRGIRLIELPNRGVAVQVGVDHFQDIDAVPEPEIRSLIRAAVSEWELKAK